MKSISIVFLTIFFLVNRSDAQITSSASGNWSAGATWVGGVVPTAGDNVVVASGHTVTIDTTNAVCNDLSVSGTVTFPDVNARAITINGNCSIGATGKFNTYASGNPVGIKYQNIVLYKDLTVSTGGTFDMRRGSNPNVGVGRVVFAGTSNSVITLSQTVYGSSTEEFNSVVINKTGGAKVILAAGNLFQNNNTATAADTLLFVSGVIETGANTWAHLSTGSGSIQGASASSYINGKIGRGISNGGGVTSRDFPVGDTAKYRPMNLRLIAPVNGTGHYVWVKIVNGNANMGSSAFSSGIDKVSVLRYYEFGYLQNAGSAATMGFYGFRPTYNTDDGVNSGNSDLRVAYSTDNRATWIGAGPTNDTTALINPPTAIAGDSLAPAINANTGTSMFVSLSRATGTTTNPLTNIPSAPTFTMNVTSVDFTPVFVGTTREDSVTVTNGGNDTLRILEISSTSPRFTLTDTTGVIAPSGSKTFVITFAGTDTLLVTAKIIFTHNAAQGKDTLSVQGKASLTPQAVLSLNKTQINFGYVSIGQWKSDSIVVANTGNDTLWITNIVSTSAAFVCSDSAFDISPAGSKKIFVTYTAADTNSANGLLVFSSNAPTVKDTVKLQGKGAQALLSLNKSQISFGVLAVGASKKDSALVSNTGTDTLKISSVVSTRAIFVPGFASATILPGQGKYCVITVTLDSAKQRTAYVVFTSNGMKGVDSVKVTVDPSTGIADNESVPLRYGLEQNYPNPFNPSTTISFSVPSEQLTILTVYDILGREVATLIHEIVRGGNHAIVWDAKGQPSGVYLFRIQAKNFIEVRRALLIK